MKRNNEKPMSKTTANILLGVLLAGLGLGMVMGNKREEKSFKQDKKPASIMRAEQQKKLER